MTLTILWHADPRRVGARATCPLPAGLSRLEPIFDDGAPLDDPFVSRTPVEFVADTGGDVRLWPGHASLHYTLDSAPGRGGERLPAAVLARGVRLALGSGAMVLVEPAWSVRATGRHGLVGSSRALDAVRCAVEAFGPLAAPALVLGASGTGKELVAQALHAVSTRAKGPFVAVNVAALGAAMAPSQLFGHARGAFTGADRASLGYFGQAAGGTLLLDEIGACPHEVQAQLLRTLQSGEVQPVGGRIERVDTRVVASTDEDLGAAIAAGRFRAPLLYRLSACTLTIPPLGERPADIAVQFVHFLGQTLSALGAAGVLTGGDPRSPWLGRDILEAALTAPWPGNSRQLAAVADALARRSARESRCANPFPSVGRPVDATPVPTDAPHGAAPHGLPDATVEDALLRHDYCLRSAAERLGIGINTLRRRMFELSLPRPRDLSGEAIEQALRESDSVESAARRLRVSLHGLKLRAGQLGLAVDSGASKT